MTLQPRRPEDSHPVAHRRENLKSNFAGCVKHLSRRHHTQSCSRVSGTWLKNPILTKSMA
jgi:hypothetical protein